MTGERTGHEQESRRRDHRVRRTRTDQGAERTVTIEHNTQRVLRDWYDDDFDLEDLALPEQRQWQRCGAVHCIDRGPWIGTLVCCIRQSGHDHDHTMSLGDFGRVDFWQETWL